MENCYCSLVKDEKDGETVPDKERPWDPEWDPGDGKKG